MRMNKKGITQQVFIYIFVAFVIGIVFIFGFKILKDLNETKRIAIYQDFKINLKNDVENIFYKSPGSIIEFSSRSSRKPLILPEDVIKVCVKDKNRNLDNSEVSKLKQDEKFTVENLDKNIILFGGNYNAFDINNLNLKPEKNPLCFRIVNGRFSFILESKFEGDENFVEIREIS